MKYRNLIFGAILVLVAVFFYLMTKADVSREDLGKLTIANHNANIKYCTYVIIGSRVSTGGEAFYQKNDVVCIECIDSPTKTWPPKQQNNQWCYTYITFTSSDGFVEYDADIQDRQNRVCTTCPNAKGYYKSP